MRLAIQLRLVNGVVENDVQRASDEVHHLARLMLTSDLLMSMTALGALGLEQSLAEEIGVECLPPGWAPISKSLRARARRVFYAYPAFIGPWAPKGIRESFTEPAMPGFCSSIPELVAALAFARPLLADHFRDSYERIALLVERDEACALAGFGPCWTATTGRKISSSYYDNLLEFVEGSGAAHTLSAFGPALRWSPALRRMAGEVFLAISTLSFRHLYEEALPED